MELAIRNLALSTTLTLCAAEGYAEINRLQNLGEFCHTRDVCGRRQSLEYSAEPPR